MTYKILSFDGGGIRGVISLTFLQALEEKTGISISQKADIIGGTSTGSIIAVALSIGMTATDILNFYTSMSKEIFKKEPSIDRLLLLKPKYSNKHLYEALEKIFSIHGYQRQDLLQKLPKEVVIPSVNLDDKQSSRWRAQVFTRASTVSLIDAVMESTAAPTFFPSYKDHIDGGMAANDPSLIAYAHARGNVSALLSFGTGYTTRNISKGEAWGALSWIVDALPKINGDKTPLIDMLIDVQEQLPGQLSSLLLREKYRRINLHLSEPAALDDTAKIPLLIEETKKYIQKNSSSWEETCKWVHSHFGE